MKNIIYVSLIFIVGFINAMCINAPQLDKQGLDTLIHAWSKTSVDTSAELIKVDSNKINHLIDSVVTLQKNKKKDKKIHWVEHGMPNDKGPFFYESEATSVYDLKPVYKFDSTIRLLKPSELNFDEIQPTKDTLYFWYSAKQFKFFQEVVWYDGYGKRHTHTTAYFKKEYIYTQALHSKDARLVPIFDDAVFIGVGFYDDITLGVPISELPH